MAIFDCFTYFNEDHLLRLRLETLADTVDRFIIAEATHTQTGRPKPLNFDIDKFSAFRDRITYVVVDDMPVHLKQPWENERHQRRALMRGLTTASDSDIVLVSDLDEIPKPQSIAQYEPRYLRATLLQTQHYYRFNWVSIDQTTREIEVWRNAQITTMGHIRRFFGDTQQVRIFNPRGPLRALQRQWLKRLRNQEIADGGWHFSWVTDETRIREKIMAMAHQEFNIGDVADIATINRHLTERTDLLRRNVKLEHIPPDYELPPYLVGHSAQYQSYFAPAAEAGADATAHTG